MKTKEVGASVVLEDNFYPSVNTRKVALSASHDQRKPSPQEFNTGENEERSRNNSLIETGKGGKRRDSSSEQDNLFFKKYDKAKPELKGPIEDFSQKRVTPGESSRAVVAPREDERDGGLRKLVSFYTTPDPSPTRTRSVSPSLREVDDGLLRQARGVDGLFRAWSDLRVGSCRKARIWPCSTTTTTKAGSAAPTSSLMASSLTMPTTRRAPLQEAAITADVLPYSNWGEDFQVGMQASIPQKQ
ncbi:uncharacterized protein [Aegilops tauschii subsp. strangulata]|uniref:uncharacterized protein n=1 Tax=Aegilops tauschii subsp. strangulata TaxID=200361 RepID=UPI003CC857C6